MRSLWDHQCVIVGHHGVVEGVAFVIVIDIISSGSMAMGRWEYYYNMVMGEGKTLVEDY